jgi:hypothetical protein
MRDYVDVEQTLKGIKRTSIVNKTADGGKLAQAVGVDSWFAAFAGGDLA